MGEILLEKPYIQKHGDKSRLCCQMTEEGKSSEIWYEVSCEYEEFLCAERMDAFVVAILPYAMYHKKDLRVQGTTSMRLAYQLQNFFVPALAKYTNNFHSAAIYFDQLSSQSFHGKGVGTGVSGGVDSFYTIVNHLDHQQPAYNLTHLTFFNVGSNGDFGGEEARRIFLSRAKAAKALSEKIGLPFLAVDSNISDILQMNFEMTCAYRSLSAVLALQKLFSVYLFSSGESIDMFHIDGIEASYHDLLNVQCFSTESTQIYPTGITETRFEKISAIMNNRLVQENLNVCIADSENCGHCDKCVRTMNALYALGKLDDFDKVFDVQDYKDHLDERLGYMLVMKEGKEYVNINHRETYQFMVENGLKIPEGAFRIEQKNRRSRMVRRIKNKFKAIKRKYIG